MPPSIRNNDQGAEVRFEIEQPGHRSSQKLNTTGVASPLKLCPPSSVFIGVGRKRGIDARKLVTVQSSAFGKDHELTAKVFLDRVSDPVDDQELVLGVSNPFLTKLSESSVWVVMSSPVVWHMAIQTPIRSKDHSRAE